ncbi:DUF4296 domain-containing protein [Leptobacterium flavescens]|uniref:DUF4296 domain-containing protein n=1 Tax=Leptobacterium flavescens TaxID=472055 RepID=A0A6P0UQ52_9FLAO|nr:DUF4296 domain-containing protein [Leptobacterium flavescens]NER14600.1 DUF4296 domain-containing protein [Leptobacterium flavescens]
MRKSVVLFIGVLLMLMSCEVDRYEKPDNLIDENTMSDILYELSIFYAAKGINVQRFQAEELDPESFVYSKFKIDSTQFAASSVYYASKPDIYIKIYERVEERLKARREQLIELSEKKKAELDSVRKSRVTDTTRLKKGVVKEQKPGNK